jgi:radical SAM protein with 4Fe4S-binding SPASM domain
MLRISEYIRDSLAEKPVRAFGGVICIWNLTNFCNLFCDHCYSSSVLNRDGDLSTEETLNLVPQLKEIGVRFAILSGGEPLTRPDVYEIAEACREHKMGTYLSTNGLLIKEKNIDRIAKTFSYVGISIDGTPDIHDQFRGKKGAYERSMNAVRLCLSRGIKVGIRFTLAPLTVDCLPHMFDLVEEENIPKLYISHLVTSGRGNDLPLVETKTHYKTSKAIIDQAFDYHQRGIKVDVVTGNNEPDAILLLEKFRELYPAHAEHMEERLKTWGGNQSGSRLLNINSKGEVRPDPFFFDSVGNVTETPLPEIWSESELLQKLRNRKTEFQGQCRTCPHLSICNGNSRARAYAAHGDYFKEDPGCYLVGSVYA